MDERKSESLIEKIAGLGILASETVLTASLLGEVGLLYYSSFNPQFHYENMKMTEYGFIASLCLSIPTLIFVAAAHEEYDSRHKKPNC